jgi:superfamily II DNA or RNA helicase
MQDRVFLLLKESPEPLTAREIASKLNSTRTDVNAALYSFLNQGIVRKICHTSGSAPFWCVLPGPSGPQVRRIQRRPKPTTEPPLYRWQKEAFEKWRDTGYRGMLEAVTGSGKTRFALDAASRLCDATDQHLFILVVVPTITLMDQWYDEAVDFFREDQRNLIGRRGDGHHDNFSKPGRQLIIAVKNSAAKHVHELLSFTSNAGAKTLLIADEVHRLLYAEQHGKVLDFPFDYTLGMSATLPPKREHRLGDCFYRFTFEDAKREGTVPSFDLVQISVTLNGRERSEYDDLTQQIHDQMEWVKRRYRNELGDALDDDSDDRLLRELGWIHRCNFDPQIERLFGCIFQRSAISHKCEQKLNLATQLGAFLMAQPGRGKRIFFFERIESAESARKKIVEDGSVTDSWKEIARRLHECDPDAWCKTMQSGLKSSERRQILEEFRSRPSATLLCCRMLDEGLNVPEIDVAVLVSSSQTKRQRIQRIGRALRKTPTGKQPLIISFHVSETTDANTIRYDEELFSGVAKKIYKEDAVTSLRRVEELLARQ